MAKKEKTTVSNDADLGMQELVSELIESQDILYKELDSLFTSLDILIETLEQPAELLNGIAEGFKEFFFESQGNVTGETTSADPVIEKQEDNSARVSYQDPTNVGTTTATAVPLQFTPASQADSQREFINSLLSPITERLDAISGSIENTITTLATSFEGMKSLLNVIAKPINFIGNLIKSVFTIAGGGLLFLTLSYFWDKVKDTFIGDIISAFGDALDGIWNFFKENGDDIKQFFKDIGEVFQQLLHFFGIESTANVKKDTAEVIEQTSKENGLSEQQTKALADSVEAFGENEKKANPKISNKDLEVKKRNYAKGIQENFKKNKDLMVEQAKADKELEIRKEREKNAPDAQFALQREIYDQETEAKIQKAKDTIDEQAREGKLQLSDDSIAIIIKNKGEKTEEEKSPEGQKQEAKERAVTAQTIAETQGIDSLAMDIRDKQLEPQKQKNDKVKIKPRKIKLPERKPSSDDKSSQNPVQAVSNVVNNVPIVQQNMNAQATTGNDGGFLHGFMIGMHQMATQMWNGNF